MATVEQVISKAFQLLGVEPVGESLDTAFYDDGLYTLNEMLAQWEIEELLPINRTETTHTLTASDGVYTIGSAGDIVATRPKSLTGAFIASGDSDYDLQIISKNDYDRIAQKETSGIPFKIAYDPAYPTGTLYLYPVPDTAYVLHLFSLTPFTQYTATSETIDLPNEYLSPISHTLAICLAPTFQRQVSQEVVAMSGRGLANLKRMNAQPVKTVYTKPFSHRSYRNITTGY